jgi:hexosaminidase
MLPKIYRTQKMFSMRNVLITLALLLTAHFVIAQKIGIQWEVIENHYQNKPQFLSAFTITNKDKKPLPASGWTLYFNFIRPVTTASVTGGVTIEQINGDLFRLYPLSGFAGIAPGASLRVEFVSGDWVVNFTDAPAGLYFIFDSQPTQGVPVSDYTIKPSTQPKQYLRFPEDKVGLVTPQILFEQNKVITPVAPDKLIKIFPTPMSYRETGGTFVLATDLEVVTDPAFNLEAQYLVEELSTLLGKRPVMVTSSNKKKITLQKAALAEEAYQLIVKENEILISGSTGHGIFNGIQSLKSLIPPTAWAGAKPSITIPTIEAEDAPRFPYRSFFLDVCRNFHQKEQILRLLDLIALYKLNVLHLHLTEDEGWRLEIPSLPELTQVGARRGHTLDNKNFLQPSFGSGPDVNNPFGTGHYTRADFIEILKYASQRHIKVIPEIEAPGHARAAIKSMDARYDRLMKEGKKEEAEKYLLRDLKDESVYRSVQGWDDNVINVAVPSVYTFVERVVDDVLAMYKDAGAPITMIHFGGDEVPAGVWEKSPAYHALKKENSNIQSTDDLWYYFYGNVNKILKKRGLTLYGWEEIGMRKTKLDGSPRYIPNPDFVQEQFQVDVWNNVLGWGAEDLAYRMANSGYKVVLSCVTNLYFDMAYYKAFDEPGYYWGAFVDIDKPYYFVPFDYFKNAREDKFGGTLDRSIFVGKERLTDYGKQNIVGIQGLLWSETIQGPERMEYMILPKMLSLAERAWARDPDWALEKDTKKSEQLYTASWSSFVSILGQRELPRLDYYRGGYQYRIPSPGAIIENGKIVANIQLPGLTLRYTTDGKEPTVKSKVYTSPLDVKGTVKLKAFSVKGRSGKSISITNP